MNWHNTYVKQLQSIGFTQHKNNPCLFIHTSRKLNTLVHGDDYVTSGEAHHLEWLSNEIGWRFESNAEWLGPDGGKQKREAKTLGRVISWGA